MLFSIIYKNFAAYVNFPLWQCIVEMKQWVTRLLLQCIQKIC